MSSASSPTPPTPPAREPGVEDATRRTRLANERTFLAWWRTALAAVAVSVGVGRVAPELSKSTHWPYEVLGAGYGVLAVVFVICAFLRTRAVEDALTSGRFAPIGERLLVGLTIAGAALTIATLVVLFAAN